VGAQPRTITRQPFRGAICGGDTPVDAGSELEDNERPTGRDPVEEHLVLATRLGFKKSHCHVDASGTQCARTPGS
jgi:hypothetical protein